MSKLVYSTAKQLKCPRCGIVCNHTLYDYEYALYKCNNCGNIHV